MLVKHNLKPIYNKYSKILILGSIPSIVSRENNFYYANKQNRFWKIMSTLFGKELDTIDKRIDFLLENNIALFDVIKECEIIGSSDSSISNIIVNDIDSIVKSTNINYIFCTGKTAFNLFNKYFSNLNIKCFYLPSPSSANATYSLDKLVEEYKIITEGLYSILLKN